MRKVQVKFADFVRGEYPSDPNGFTVYARADGGEWQTVGYGEGVKELTYNGLFQSDDRYAIARYEINIYTTNDAPFVVDGEAFDLGDEEKWSLAQEFTVTVGTEDSMGPECVLDRPVDYGETPAKAKAQAKLHAQNLIRQHVEDVQAIAEASREPEVREPADPDSLPEVVAEDLESHASVRTVKRAYVAGVEAEVEDCGNGAYELVLRAEHGEDLLHFVGGSPEDGAINATFSTEEMQALASLFLSFPALSRALRSPSLLPSSPPTPLRGEAKDGEDGISLSGALHYLGRQYIPIETHRMILREVYGRLDAKSEAMASHEAEWEAERAEDIGYLLAENRALSASLKALQKEKDSQYVRAWTSPGDIPGLVTERPVREDGRRRWGNALWAVACRDLGIGDCSRNGTKHIIWLDDEEEALVRLWVEEYRGGGQ